MSFLQTEAIGILSITDNVDMQTDQKNDLYTCPQGKVAYPCAVIICNPSATLAGGTDYDFGCGDNCDTWRQTVDLSSMTTANTDFMVIRGADVTKYTRMSAADVFGIKPSNGSTGAATATVIVLGIEQDA